MRFTFVALVCAVQFSAVPSLHAEQHLARWCGFGEAAAAFLDGNPEPRPEPGPKFIYTKNFVIHYTTYGEHATTRAYAESVSVYAEYCWQIQVDSLGWIEPPPDFGEGGDDRYDIYIQEMGDKQGACYAQHYYTTPYPLGATSFIKLSNSIGGWDTLRVVVAHEFNHACQLRYHHITGQVGLWWYENTATWMENVCYDDASRYVEYLGVAPNPLTNPELSITCTTDNYYYAGAIWPMFLHEYYNIACPRRAWELIGQQRKQANALTDIGHVLAMYYKSNLTEALRQYAVWRYFTGDRADTVHYFSESHLWPTSTVLVTHYKYPTSGDQRDRAPSGPGGANFIRFSRQGDEEALELSFDGQDGFNWRATMVGCRNPGQSLERKIDLDAGNQGTAKMGWDGNEHIVLVPVVTQWHPPANSLTYMYSAEQAGMPLVDTAWVRRYGGSTYFGATALAVDAAGNVYVTGSSNVEELWTEYATIKYSSSGEELWVRRYNGDNYTDTPTALAVDGAGNVYVTGTSWGPGTNPDYATIKYSPAGDELWVRRYNGPSNSDDVARALAVDGAGNVYVTGESRYRFGTKVYATIKYSPAGDELWVKEYNGPGNGDDVARALAVDGQGNVYVTGHSVGSGTSYDYATIKYSPAGDELWVRRYNGPGNDDDWAYALAVDEQGNVYVTGFSTGSGTAYDYATIKYSPEGAQLWVARYNGPENDEDGAYALAVDGQGNAYVTGRSTGSGTSLDYATIKYNTGGNQLWVARYDGPVGDYDRANAVALDDDDNVYVTGYSTGIATGFDYATIKYSPTGEAVWVARYNGPGNGDDAAYALAVDGIGNVYVAGRSSGTRRDYATIKYVQICPLHPQVWTSPRYLNATLVRIPGQSPQPVYRDLLIRNNGNTALEWSIAADPLVDWLSVIPSTGTIEPGHETVAQVRFTDKWWLPPRRHHTNLLVSSNDPDLPAKAIAVEFALVGPSLVIPVDPVAFDSITGPNTGRMLSVQPGTGNVHAVFGDGENVHYVRSTDGGETWEETLVLDEGRSPALALDGSNMPAVTFLRNDSIFLRRRLPDSSWDISVVFAGNGSDMPGPAALAAGLDTVEYLSCAYPVYNQIQNRTQVQLARIDATGLTLTTVSDTTGVPADSLVSVATTYCGPTHVAWQRSGEVWYWVESATGTPPGGGILGGGGGTGPGNGMMVSAGRQPFVETHGDQVHLVWQDSLTGAVMAANRYVWDPGTIWLPAGAVSASEAAQPVCAQGVFGWQEPDGFSGAGEIMADAAGNLINLSDSPGVHSAWPHLDVLYSYDPGSGTFVDTVYALWTEAVDDSLYEPRFGKQTAAGSILAGKRKPSASHTLLCGQERPSYYSRHRTGYRNIRGIGFDYGADSLSYELIYLDPRYDYLAELVFAQDRGRELDLTLTSKGLEFGRIQLKTEGPETLRVVLPDWARKGPRFEFRVKERTGEQAVLAGLKLYPFARRRTHRDGALAQPGPERLQPRLYRTEPNPFTRNTVIRYQLARSGRVSLRVYDAAGRLVRTLLDGEQQPGVHRATWNGTDSQGRRVAHGVYFYRLDAPGFSDTKQMVLLR